MPAAQGADAPDAAASSPAVDLADTHRGGAGTATAGVVPVWLARWKGSWSAAPLGDDSGKQHCVAAGHTIRVAAGPAADRARPMVANLWASRCGKCRGETSAMAAAQPRQTRIAWLFVKQGESPAEVNASLSGLDRPPCGVLQDTHVALAAAVDSRGLPTPMFDDARCRLADSPLGALNAAALESRLRARRAGPPASRRTASACPCAPAPRDS